jgi:two-component system CheB/CheR fusion protein
MAKRPDPGVPQGQDGGDRKGAAPRRAPCPVVGIGASAGGLEAFRAFLSAAPIDSGLAFVLVQHLAPDHRSILAELLQSVTAMPVHEIEDHITVEPNQVYVIPQDTSLTITDGTLRLAQPAQPPGHRAPIDGFFMSLAEDQGENAACVILSGGGHDGTQGLRAIKEHGGLVLAQSAETATHDSMLRSAVQTGLVDFQLPVEAMPAKLRHYFDHLRDVHDMKDADGLRAATPPDLRRICEHVRARTGHDFSGYKESTLVRRIQRRMQVLQIDELSRYTEHLRKNGPGSRPAVQGPADRCNAILS